LRTCAVESIETCISFISSKAAQTVSRLARVRLAESNVTPVQFALLQAVWQQQGQTASELSLYLVIDSATITGVIERLHKMGALRRRSDADDRRVTRIFLTRSGHALVAVLQAKMDALNAELAEAFGGEAETLWRLLGQLARFEPKSNQSRSEDV
jgi:MarR family transcriptional regulator, organic hydroperoxide resistance regulator